MPCSVTPIPRYQRSVNLTQGNSYEKGVSLIEILIAVVILSIGFLATAKMQTQGIRNGQGAYHQAQAYLMLSDMMDRMRSNPSAVSDGDYDNKWTSDSANNPGCGPSTNCTTAQLAQQDLYEWSALLHPLRGTANFTPVLHGSDSVEARAGIVPMGDGMYQMQAQWVEQLGSKDNTQTITIEFQP